MTEFKEGDKVRVTPGTGSIYDYVIQAPYTGVVRAADVHAALAGRIWVDFDNNDGGTRIMRAEDLIPIPVPEFKVGDKARVKNTSWCGEWHGALVEVTHISDSGNTFTIRSLEGLEFVNPGQDYIYEAHENLEKVEEPKFSGIKVGDRVVLFTDDGDHAEITVTYVAYNYVEIANGDGFHASDWKVESITKSETTEIPEPTETFTVVEGQWRTGDTTFWAVRTEDGMWSHQDDDETDWADFLAYLKPGTAKIVSKPV